MRRLSLCVLLVLLAIVSPRQFHGAEPSTQQAAKTLNVLFIGNSYTARHNMADVVKAMVEEGQPGVKLEAKTVIYGGRRLADHWRLGSQNFIRSSTLTADQIKATIKDLEVQLRQDPRDKYAKYAVERQRKLLNDYETTRTRWDVVVLQSYRDDVEGGPSSLYAQYAPKFAELVHAQGGKVVLYETTPTTQNDKPLTGMPDAEPVLEKAEAIAALADKIDAEVAPMSLVALECQRQRPDLTLRFVNDAHLNQTMAYLTACTLYAAILDADPRRLKLDSITDIRYWQNKDRTKDRDNLPIKKVFSDQDRADLQRIAWEGYQAMKQMRKQ
ncbi:hypothetical protein [Planctomycetes bacterium TBK1r]|uniref:SGNH hydrolase-type esterase domain-containing protein n=1 Tax=Stieleria magnilauensis TaxID=2527963 RepID=A0ABX5XLF6_9BACT|nr:hypothetical protein TBK1r_16080 [Planctomycetes bacterium TBK1r]